MPNPNPVASWLTLGDGRRPWGNLLEIRVIFYSLPVLSLGNALCLYDSGDFLNA